MTSFIFLLNKLLFPVLPIVFCPLAFPIAFAHDGEVFGVIIGVPVLLVYILFAVCVLAFVCKKWNRTNKTLEEINKKMIKN